MATNPEPIGQSIVDADATTTTTAADGSGNASSLSPAADVSDTTSTRDRGETKKGIHIYNPRKPKWWNQLGNNGRGPTKSQKRAIRTVLDGEGRTASAVPPAELPTTHGLRLPPIPYGSQLDWGQIFPDSSEDKRDIWLELGFGRGENLQALLESKILGEARQDEGKGNNHGGNNNNNSNDVNTNETVDNANGRQTKKFYLVGAEVSGVGIGCLCKRIEQLQQQQQQQQQQDDHYVLYRPEMDPYSASPGHDVTKESGNEADDVMSAGDQRWRIQQNSHSLATIYDDRLRIHAGDGYKLLPKLPTGSLSAILVTFPDPFPKDTDVKYRLVQHQTLLECHRILRKGRSSSKKEDSTIETNKNTNNNHSCDSKGRLFLATDHDGYHEWCHRIMQEVNRNQDRELFQLEEPCPDRMEWLPAVSRYEQKGWDEGRSTKLSCWVAI